MKKWWPLNWKASLALLVLLAVLMVSGGAWGQWGRRRSAPEDVSDRRGVPNWSVNDEFATDVFTFVRVKFTSVSRGRRWRGWSWDTDYPDSDLNFSFRLQQLTSLQVRPDPIVLELTDPRLMDHPFIYMCEPGNLLLSEDEVRCLRRYLDNGGFLMADDFWGEEEYWNFYGEMKRVYPDREPVDLPLEHEIFHCVYELAEKPQIPAIGVAMAGRNEGITWERWDAQEVHYRAFLDANQRISIMICHNTDLGDGWEREGMNEWYFREFSEKKAYPLGINIVVYALTH